VHSTRKSGDDSLRDSALQYRALRPNNWQIPKAEYLSHAMASLAREMETMTENHVVLNVLRRLVRYVRLRYNLPNNRDAESFIRGSFMDAVLTNDQRQFKEWIGVNPCFESTVKKNLAHFIRKLADVVAYYEQLDPNTKGVRMFTLLPLKGGFIPSFFMIDSTTLPDLLKLLPRVKQEEIVRDMMSVLGDDKSDEYKFLLVRLRSRAIFNQDFQKMTNVRQTLWNLLFNIKKFETSRRKFANILSTNGYAVTVYLQVPKVDVVEYDSERILRRNHEFTRFIGIDPGGTFVCTSYDGEKCVQVSAKELRHSSKMNQQKDWQKKQCKVDECLRALPSLKTVSFETFKDRVQITLSLAAYLIRFSSRAAFRAWRFKIHRFGQEATAKAVTKVLGVVTSTTLVGFGD